MVTIPPATSLSTRAQIGARAARSGLNFQDHFSLGEVIELAGGKRQAVRIEGLEDLESIEAGMLRYTQVKSSQRSRPLSLRDLCRTPKLARVSWIERLLIDRETQTAEFVLGVNFPIHQSLDALTKPRCAEREEVQQRLLGLLPKGSAISTSSLTRFRIQRLPQLETLTTIVIDGLDRFANRLDIQVDLRQVIDAYKRLLGYVREKAEEYPSRFIEESEAATEIEKALRLASTIPPEYRYLVCDEPDLERWGIRDHESLDKVDV